MTCRAVQAACKRAGEKRPYGFDLTGFTTRRRRNGGIYLEGVRVRPPTPYGFELEATVGGQAGSKAVRFPGAVGGTVVDGSVTWTARAISNESLERTISTVEWIVPDAITVTEEEIINDNGVQQFGAQFSGGEEDTNYLLIGRVTFSDGTIEDFGIDLEVD